MDENEAIVAVVAIFAVLFILYDYIDILKRKYQNRRI